MMGKTDSSDAGEQKKKSGKAKQGDGTTTSAKESDLTSKLDAILASAENIPEQNKALSARVAALEQPQYFAKFGRSFPRSL